MAEALKLTAIGMGLVFAAMALVLAAMVLLTRLRDTAPQTEAKGTSNAETPAVDERSRKLRVAMIAAAIARAKSQTTPTLNLPSAPATASSWWSHHHIRQLSARRPR